MDDIDDMDDDTTTAGLDDAVTSVVRISGPADILGVLPYRIGFHPSESLVVVCLEGPRRRDRLVMRVDLPAPAEQRGVVADIAERVAHVGASSSVVVVYTEDADAGRGRTRLAGAGLVQALRSAFRRREIHAARGPAGAGRPMVVLPVPRPRLLPARGHAAPGGADRCDPALRRRGRRAGRAGAGRPGRAAPQRRAVRPRRSPRPCGGWPGRRPPHSSTTCWPRAGRPRCGCSPWPRWRGCARAGPAATGRLEPADAALVLLGLHDKRVRDATMTGVLDDDADTLLDLLGALARQADDADAAPVCTALGWVAYAHGHGALAAVAAERALRCAPGYSMAQLLLDGLDRMLGPEHVRAVSEAVRAELADLDVLDDLEEELYDWEDPMDELDDELGDAC